MDTGRSADALKREFLPWLPTTKSRSPSLSRSDTSIAFHQPLVSPRPPSVVRSTNIPLSLIKILTGMYSPITIKSGSLSRSMSAHMPSVIIPDFFSWGATSAVAFSNLPFPSFFRIYPFIFSPYEKACSRMPTNKSWSPSKSKSAAATVEELSNLGVGSTWSDFVKFPSPSLK